jgi:hypothetical protein
MYPNEINEEVARLKRQFGNLVVDVREYDDRVEVTRLLRLGERIKRTLEAVGDPHRHALKVWGERRAIYVFKKRFPDLGGLKYE